MADVYISSFRFTLATTSFPLKQQMLGTTYQAHRSTMVVYFLQNKLFFLRLLQLSNIPQRLSHWKNGQSHI